MIDDGIGIRRVPWYQFLTSRSGRTSACVVRNVGGTDWSFGKQYGLDLSVLPRSYEEPQQRHLLVAVGPDRRHPVRAGAHRAPTLRGW
jgi:hypothetical protein